MALFSWIEAIKELSAGALTVRAQAVDPTLQNRLLWDQFAPRQDVDSTELETLLEGAEVEYVGERREWDTRGRPIAQPTVSAEKLEFIPIETTFTVMEKEINDLMMRFVGNQQLMVNQIAPTIPKRTDRLVNANYRRIEKDTFDGWATRAMTRRNPTLGNQTTYTYTFVPAAQYPTVPTAWDDASVNAFQEFVKSIPVAEKVIGLVDGVIMRQVDFDLLVEDANDAVAFGTTFPILKLTSAQSISRIREELRKPNFIILIYEDTLTVFNDGGITNTTEVDRWPVGKIGFIPAAGGGAVGFNAFAPVVRAYDLTSQVPDAGIDVRGMTVLHEVANGGRSLIVECQVNAFFVPIPERIWVLDIGTG